MSQLFILVTVEIGIVNFFAGFEVSAEATSIPSVQSNTDNNDSISTTETPYKAVGPFNNDNDFANFQLGEFGVTQSNFVSHHTQRKFKCIFTTTSNIYV